MALSPNNFPAALEAIRSLTGENERLRKENEDLRKQLSAAKPAITESGKPKK